MDEGEFGPLRDFGSYGTATWRSREEAERLGGLSI